MIIDKENLIAVLESLFPGVSPKEVVQQSSCIIFSEGRAFTYNDEIACSRDCELKIEGAVPAAIFVNTLKKMPDETVEITQEKNKLTIKGKRRKASIVIDEEILLPIDAIREDMDEKEWEALPTRFCEGIEAVRGVTSTNDSFFSFTCVHVGPDFIEACDNTQAARFTLETGLESSLLIRFDAALHLGGLAASHFIQTDTWMHFRQSEDSSLCFSVRVYCEDYPSLESIFDAKGSKIAIPDSLIPAIETANLFSSETSDDDFVIVNIKPSDKKGKGVLRIKGQGVFGSYSESKKIKFSGTKGFEFLSYPKILIEAIKRAHECFISEKAIRIESGDLVYIARLSAAEKEEE